MLDGQADGTQVRRGVLPCGLRVLTERLPGTRSVAAGFWVAVGSRDEPPELAGVAHYLEHLLFKGTTRRSAASIAEEIDTVGGELNAFTDKEHTCYYAHVLDCDLPLAVDLLCDVIGDALLNPSDVNRERTVVLDEIAMRDDDPEDLLQDEFSAALMGSHALGRPVLGTEDSITRMERSALRRFYLRRYRPERMVLAVAGNVTHEAVLECLRHSLGDRLAATRADPVAPRRGRARVTGHRRLAVRPAEFEQAHLMLGVRAVDRHDERRTALRVLNAALGGGMSSRLFQQVREQRGLAYSVYSTVTCYADCGDWSIYAGCCPDRLGELSRVVGEVLDTVARDGLSDAELARAKGQLRGGLVLGTEDPSSRMARLGEAELSRGEHHSVEESLRRIDEVTGQQVAVLSRELLRRPFTAAVVGPYAGTEDLPDEIAELIA